MTEETKVCRRCKEEKPLSSFHKNSGKSGASKGVQAYCKPCQKAHRAEVISADRESFLEWNRERYARRGRGDYLRRVYGLTPEQYDEMLAKQGGRCALCPATEPGGHTKNFRVDHDHATGKVRGLLCNDCNLALGKFKDNVAVMERAIEYLRAHAPVLEVACG